jgi:hypothetical protein
MVQFATNWLTLDHLALGSTVIGRNHLLATDRLHVLCAALTVMESEIAPLQTERERIRADLSVVIVDMGGKVKLDGAGRLDVRQASMHVSYDRTQIDHVILKLVDAGQDHVADALRACTKESMPPGTRRSLRTLPDLTHA